MVDYADYVFDEVEVNDDMKKPTNEDMLSNLKEN
jgi:hypothetical protein